MKNTKELQAVFNFYATNDNIRQILQTQLVGSGQVSQIDINKIFMSKTKVENIDAPTLALIYKTIYTIEQKAGNDANFLNPPTYYFTPVELEDSLLVASKKGRDEYPIEFNDVVELKNDEYLFTLSCGQIFDLAATKLLRLNTDFQRESFVVSYGNQTIPVVKLNKAKVEEIRQNISSGDQHPTTLRFHFVPDTADLSVDEETHSFVNNTLTLYKGELFNIDGNHRINAILQAVSDNMVISEMFRYPVILTIGSAASAGGIIIQDEKRTPINLDHLKSMQESDGIKIVRMFEYDSEITELYGRFSSTIEQCRIGGGLLVKFLVGDAIEQNFKLRNMRKSKKEDLAKYICNCLIEWAYAAEEKIEGIYRNYSSHLSWAFTNENAVYGLMWLFGKMYADNIGETEISHYLERVVEQVDFKSKTSDKKEIIRLLQDAEGALK